MGFSHPFDSSRYSIISCIKSLVWVIAVLALMLGLFAVLFTSATGSELDSLEKRRDPRNALLVTPGDVDIGWGCKSYG